MFAEHSQFQRFMIRYQCFVLVVACVKFMILMRYKFPSFKLVYKIIILAKADLFFYMFELVLVINMLTFIILIVYP